MTGSVLPPPPLLDPLKRKSPCMMNSSEFCCQISGFINYIAPSPPLPRTRIAKHGRYIVGEDGSVVARSGEQMIKPHLINHLNGACRGMALVLHLFFVSGNGNPLHCIYWQCFISIYTMYVLYCEKLCVFYNKSDDCFGQKWTRKIPTRY